MSELRITFNSAGFREILLGDGVKDLVTETAKDIAAKANANYGGDGFDARVWQGNMMSKYSHGGRWLASVTSTDRTSAIAEAEEKALSRAVSE